MHEGENPARTEPVVPAGTAVAGAATAEAQTAGAETAGAETAEARTAGAEAADAADAAAADVTGRVAGVLQGIGPVLGIDAGGTGTRAVLIVDGAPTQRYSSGPFNFLLDGDGVPRMTALVQAAHPAAVGIGVPGLARVPDAAATFAAAITEASGVPARVAPDATAAWLDRKSVV